jgi:uncharacterized membrane protein YecN with MAPEG domain
MITQLYTGILGLIFCILSVNVIVSRRQKGASLGTEDDTVLRKVSAHNNFTQYSVFFIILMFLCEDLLNTYLLHTAACIFLLGRLSHIYGILYTETLERPKYVFRVFGMTLTFILIVAMSVLCIYFFCATNS